MSLRYAFEKKNSLCFICRYVLTQKCSYSDKIEQNYSEEQKHKILQVMNESDSRSLSRYDITKARIKYINQWKNSNGNLKCLSDIDMVEGFSDKYAIKLFDSILNGPLEVENNGIKASKKIKGTILQPLLSETIRQVM
ncbi:unnamed protein product [Diatraea saccharalis]|uniref:Uncharacterized protein n=1 Tax=Diatraea saccharalis TaxID=40085 RepID=A0A9N9R5Z0_9NEOP|nr:unnamed protein product [Diatraea saccharalis]